MKSTISDDEARGALNDKEREAEEMLNDANKAGQLLAKAKELLREIGKLPVISKIIDDLTTTIDMIVDFVAGRYKVSKSIITSALGGIIYLVSPVDLIPDFIPLLGWIDDVTVFTLILSLGLAAELEEYRKWKESYRPVTGCGYGDVIDVEYRKKTEE